MVLKKAPSDTCMRERLDVVSPEQFRRPFKKIFSYLQRGKVLDSYRYLDGHYIIFLDGTGQFSSEKVHCECCCEKHHKNVRIEYYHHMLGAVLVHPGHRVYGVRPCYLPLRWLDRILEISFILLI